jgi:3-mercaptopyruvate sulfurtransferase SseA
MTLVKYMDIIDLSEHLLVETEWLAVHIADNNLHIEELWEKVHKSGIKPEHRLITYCGVGISASLGLLALYLAGYRDVALYDASWEEWGTDSKRQVEKA